MAKLKRINHLSFATNIKGEKTDVDCRVFMNQALCQMLTIHTACI